MTAFIRFRTGSHTLEIERGRYTNPRTPIEDRLCIKCNEIEDEIHFLIQCTAYENERTELFRKITTVHGFFNTSSAKDTYIFLMTSDHPDILTWVAKFIYESMTKRAEIHIGS